MEIQCVTYNFNKLHIPFANTVDDYTGCSKSLCAPDNYSTKLIWKWPSQNTFRMWTVLYWTHSSRTQFGMSINVWRLAGDTLNITCNFLYCNHQVHRDFLITLYYLIIYILLLVLPKVKHLQGDTDTKESVWTQKYIIIKCVMFTNLGSCHKATGM